MSIRRIFLFLLVATAFLLATGTQTTSLGSNGNDTGLIAGRNVNMVPFPLLDSEGEIIPHTGDPYLQRQNEPSIAVSTRNPLHLLAGANDYRTIDIPFKDELPGFEKASAAKDAWLGVFKSIDGGQTWKSTLLPGFPQDTSVKGKLSPLRGFSAAADPVVRAGTNGLFYYSGIVFNREEYGRSKVFVARYIDNNNKENSVDSIKYINTRIIDSAKGLKFIDKPHIANDIPRGHRGKIWIAGQRIPRSNVYIAYTAFYGTKTNPNAVTKIFFARSTNCGSSWKKPRILDIAWDFAYGKEKSDYYDEYRCYRKRGRGVNQGAVIAVDPTNGDVYVAWRRFGMGMRPDAIFIAKSTNQGRRFSKPVKVVEIDPFDQPTTNAMFRTNDYPTMAVDHNGVVYLAWTERGIGPFLEARIMITTSKNGKDWSTPSQVISDMDSPGDPHNNNPPGHQFMPQLTYAAGKLSMLWYDQRWDIADHFIDFYIEDKYVTRHTSDVRFAQALTSNPNSNPPSNPIFSPSIQVTRYPFLFFTEDDPPVPGSEWYAIQLLFNKPNLPLFAQGTVPFMGDYIGIAPSPLILPPDPNDPHGNWTFNTDLETPTVYHAVWTDNRDVIQPPTAGDVWTEYNAPNSQCVNPDFTGVRNQNIYTSRISEGIIAGSPGNTKPLNILRSFVVFVKNETKNPRFLKLEISAPPDVTAFFWQENLSEPTTLDVEVPPYSYLSKTVLVERFDANKYASVIVNVKEGIEVIYSITLNPDSTNPEIDDSEGVDPDLPSVADEGETHTPHTRNYTVHDWTYDSENPSITTIHPDYDISLANNDGVTPYTVEGYPENPHTRNPHTRNPHTRNPHTRNNLLNPHTRNGNIPDFIPADSHITDVIRTIENAGNTTTSYSINTFNTPEDMPQDVLAQLIIFKTYTTATVDPFGQDANGCQLIGQEHQQMVANEILSPHTRNVGLLGEVTVTAQPKEVFHVLYRFYNPNQTPEQQEFHDEEKFEEATPDIASDTPDTAGDDIDPSPPKLLILKPKALPNGLVGETYPDTQLEAEGGTAPYEDWAITEGSLPSNLTLNTTSGVISGSISQSTLPGTYRFKVEVYDSDDPPQATTQWFSIVIPGPLDSFTVDAPETGTAGIGFLVTVTAKDAYGETTTIVSGTTILSVDGAGSITPDSIAEAEFTDDGVWTGTVTLTESGSRTITSDNSGKTGFDVLAIMAGAATQLAFSVQPDGATAGEVFTQQPVVEIHDQFHNIVTSDSFTEVTLTIDNDPSSSAFLSGSNTVMASSGVAEFSDLSIDNAGTEYTLEATSYPSVYTADTSDPFDVLAKITGTLLYNGQPILTTADVYFWAYKGGLWYLIPAQYNSIDGTYSIPSISPGVYKLNVYIDAAPPHDEKRLPGDFAGTKDSINVPAGESEVVTDIDCIEYIHITAPIDNDSSQGAYPPDPYDTYISPILFQWDAISGATRYDIDVQKYQHHPTHVWLEAISIPSTSNTQISIDLPGVPSNQHYELRITAHNNTYWLGETTIVYDAAYGTDYRFRITPVAAYLELTGNSSMTAGTTNELTITAYDEYDNVDTTYSGQKSLIFSGLAPAPDGTEPTVAGEDIGDPTLINFTNGVSDAGAATLIAYKAENNNLNVSDGTISTSYEDASYDLFISVDPADAAKLLWDTQPTSPIAQSAIWDAFSVEITDQYENRTNDNDKITLWPATLGGTREKNATNGLATFDDIFHATSGTLFVQGSSGSLSFTSQVSVDVLLVLNDVPNPSFENGPAGGWPTGWERDINGHTYFWQSGGVPSAKDGMKKVGILSGATCGARFGIVRTTDFIAITPGASYNLSVWYYWAGDPDDDQYHSINIRYYDKKGNFLGGVGQSTDVEDASTKWEKSTKSISVPLAYGDKPVFMAKILLEMDTVTPPSDGGATLWFDLVELNIISP